MASHTFTVVIDTSDERPDAARRIRGELARVVGAAFAASAVVKDDEPGPDGLGVHWPHPLGLCCDHHRARFLGSLGIPAEQQIALQQAEVDRFREDCPAEAKPVTPAEAPTPEPSTPEPEPETKDVAGRCRVALAKIQPTRYVELIAREAGCSAHEAHQWLRAAVASGEVVTQDVAGDLYYARDADYGARDLVVEIEARTAKADRSRTGLAPDGLHAGQCARCGRTTGLLASDPNAEAHEFAHVHMADGQPWTEHVCGQCYRAAFDRAEAEAAPKACAATCFLLGPSSPCTLVAGHRGPHSTTPGVQFGRDGAGAEYMHAHLPTAAELDEPRA